MIRIAHIILGVMAIWTAVLLFWTSQSVQKAEYELQLLKQVSYSEHEMVRVLSSEWDYLNRPERLEKLAQEYLSIKRIKSDEDNFMTSAELINNVDELDVERNILAPEKNPAEPTAKLVSTKNNSTVLEENKVLENNEKNKDIIRKAEQDNFTSMINDLTESAR